MRRNLRDYCCRYAKAVLKFAKLNTVAQQREAVYSWAKPIALPATVYFLWSLLICKITNLRILEMQMIVGTN
ncbi:MAG: hypothetical protein LBK06_02780 [Planctomycetaceae bacterium]|nr:hypothetical protein [Planctomycetaceae bacterium]